MYRSHLGSGILTGTRRGAREIGGAGDDGLVIASSSSSDIDSGSVGTMKAAESGNGWGFLLEAEAAVGVTACRATVAFVGVRSAASCGRALPSFLRCFFVGGAEEEEDAVANEAADWPGVKRMAKLDVCDAGPTRIVFSAPEPDARVKPLDWLSFCCCLGLDARAADDDAVVFGGGAGFATAGVFAAAGPLSSAGCLRAFSRARCMSVIVASFGAAESAQRGASGAADAGEDGIRGAGRIISAIVEGRGEGVA
jgi:hypothetical protein